VDERPDDGVADALPWSFPPPLQPATAMRATAAVAETSALVALVRIVRRELDMVGDPMRMV